MPAGGTPNRGFNTISTGYWGTFDINGDGRPDLVETSVQGQARVFGFGADPYWKVYLNSGSGFGAPTNWKVPAGGIPSGGFYTVSGAYWNTFDMNGDGRVDLVETAVQGQPQVFGFGASPYWKVYLNSGTSFNAASTWNVPAIGTAGLYTTFDTRWSTYDLNGDGRPDLIESSNDRGVVFGLGSDPHWRLYDNLP